MCGYSSDCIICDNYDCDEKLFITSPKHTGWTNEDDKIIDDALELIGLNSHQKWTARMRLSGISRLSIMWSMEDIKKSGKRIEEIVRKSLDQFAE